MFPDYESIKSWYELKLWTKDMVKMAVVCKVITVDQFKTITGDDYAA
ncbi:XkdX family protein [Furfurilactobacillus milii]|uniref:XkdX family protein n=1 Tax=Furfurilactobacillus milii TaxID=2888272 RepID=A0ABT6DDB7_9LACO|nr:XkdX family protein [Furfurilactobacillus milii]QLE66914.1 hypothetical protein LROSL2_1564 [Furfurilactobacillus rossiae]MCF6161924.1 XkdX family protein [Furfurilactobacillus milii]MCF6164304.1 XkdX family protein [Furfurilactobacillus milii]MDF9914792.1 XkdX family protein [Furfurilactobacillus milii]QLE69344.1 hypothetical protein LROSL3_1565 [Furfurilactobacillus rossiae]